MTVHRYMTAKKSKTESDSIPFGPLGLLYMGLLAPSLEQAMHVKRLIPNPLEPNVRKWVNKFGYTELVTLRV